jgi:hypothetical protein
VEKRRQSSRVFLLSPANCGGVRARMVMSPVAQFELARWLRSPEGTSLGDLFSFVSGLYFRGKLAYARRFAQPPDPADPVAAGGVLVITPNAGLRSPDTRMTLASLEAFAAVSIDLANAAYRRPLERGARALRDAIGPDCDVVLLGSIASGKYVEVLGPIFGNRLVFPPAFVGRGDMSRGGLMLRCVLTGVELEYAPIDGATRRGRRPPKLVPIKGILGHGTPEGVPYDSKRAGRPFKGARKR